MDEAEGASAPPALREPQDVGKRVRQTTLLAVGVALLAILFAANDAEAVVRAAASARWRVLAVIGAHLPETFFAALAWCVLLNREQRPTIAGLFRLRLIKEAVNALLPVAQVGGDVVRARLAANARLPLRTAAASCIVDIGISTASLAIFVMSGLIYVVFTTDDPRVLQIGLQLAIAAGLLTAALVIAERLGVLRLIDFAAARSEGALGRLAGLGEEVKGLLRRRRQVVQSTFWHLVSWGLGVVETSASLWAIGLEPTLERALVLESLAQGVRALGFAVPGALGVQEGGYILICGSLGIPPGQALALSLLRRVRELTLGTAGLLTWRNLARARREARA